MKEIDGLFVFLYFLEDKLDFCLGIDALVRILDLIADLAFLFMELLVGVAIYMVCLGVVLLGRILPISFVTSTTAWGTLVTTSSFLICRKDLGNTKAMFY